MFDSESQNSLYNDKDSERTPDLYKGLEDSSISEDKKIKSEKQIHFLCKKCERIPLLKFFINNKIEYICECEDSPRKISVEKIFELLYDDYDIENKNLKCYLHQEKYFGYCKKCNINLCYNCTSNCSSHKKEIIPFAFETKTNNEKEYINKKLQEKNESQNINIIDNNDSRDKYIPINSRININQKNHQKNSTDNDNSKESDCLINKKEKNYIYNEKEKDIININNAKINIEDNYYFNKLFNLILNDYYDYPNLKHFETISNIEKFVTFSFGDYNEINIDYIFKEEDIKDNKIKVFGQGFVHKNKENCFLIVGEKLMELNEFICLSDIFDKIPTNSSIKLEIKLIERKTKKINDLSFMFHKVTAIMISKLNYFGFNFKNITDMRYMFYRCSSLKILPDISNWDTRNVTNMDFMFYDCSSLSSIPDISKWNTRNVTRMKYMFYKCSSLSSFPDISKWDTSNLTGTDFMFCHCSSLSSFPDISKWNTKKLIYTYNMFKNNIILLNFSNLTKFVKKIPKIHIKKDNIYLRYFESILDIINYIDLGYGLDYYSSIQYYFTILLTIFFAFFIYKGPFTPLDNSFNLVELYNYINNQISYSNILNHSDINIFRKMINDNTISTIIDIGTKEKEILINKIKILNFTSINGNISFESDKIYYQVYNIIIVIIFFISEITLIFIIFNIQYKYISSSNAIILLLILFFLNAFSIFIEVLDYNINRKLFESFKKYYNRVKKMFDIKIPLVNLGEHKNLNESVDVICLYLLLSIFIDIFIIILFKKLI